MNWSGFFRITAVLASWVILGACAAALYGAVYTSALYSAAAHISEWLGNIELRLETMTDE